VPGVSFSSLRRKEWKRFASRRASRRSRYFFLAFLATFFFAAFLTTFFLAAFLAGFFAAFFLATLRPPNQHESGRSSVVWAGADVHRTNRRGNLP